MAARLQTIDLIFAIEPDGFVAGSQLAYELGKGFIPVRKQGKLPSHVLAIAAGGETLEVHEEAVRSGARVLLIGGSTPSQRSDVADALRSRGLYVLEHDA